MDREKFFKLNTDQRYTLLLAMHIRNKMEDFHVENLSDKQMKELNKIVRKAIFEFITHLGNNLLVSFLSRSIPSYWEIPALSKKPCNMCGMKEIIWKKQKKERSK